MNEPTRTFITGISNFLCKTLLILGLWTPKTDSTLKMTAYSIYSAVFLFIFPILYAFFMVCNIFFMTDFSDLSKRLYMSLTEIALIIKAINFFVYNREWQMIFNEIKNFRIKSDKERRTVADRHGIFQKVTSIYFFNANSYGCFMALIGAMSGSIMYSGWYPGFDWENNERDFWIVFAFQSIGMAITANMNLLLDSYYCFMMLMTSAHVKIFGNRLGSMQMSDNRSIARVRMELIKQIHDHQRIDANLESIEKNLQWSYLSQVVLSVIIISSTAMEVARVPVADDPILFLGNLIAPLNFAMQIGLMCVFGQGVMSEYDSLTQQLYNSDWPKMIAAERKDNPKNLHMILVYFMMTLKRERKIVIGKMVPLSLNTFSSILSMAYRLFTILK